MATLNVTYAGRSADVAQIEFELGDDDVRRIADETVASHSTWKGVTFPDCPHLFVNFVVDRFENRQMVYLRPKVPFGD